MDTPINNLNEAVATLVADLPIVVQNFISSPERNNVVISLSQKYKLHTDVSGTFERAFIFMLLGVFTPDEFVQELKEAGLDPQTVSGLTADVNAQVFKKLRDEERDQPKVASVPVMQVGAPVAPAFPPMPAVPTPPAPGASSQEWSSGVVPSAPPIVQSAPLPSIPTYEEVSVQPVVPKFRTMASDMQSLAGGTSPKNQSMPPSQSMPQQTSPARSFQTSSVPATNIPPVLPGQESSPVSAVFSSAPKIPSPETPSFRYSEPSIKTSASSLDPYREPTE